MKELIGDKAREKLAQNLNSLSVDTIMAESGRLEEKIENSWFQRSLGEIGIPGGLVE